MQVVDQVIQVVRDVARYEVMPRFLRVGKTRKEDGSLFTEADLACQQVLQQRLPAILPYPVLGEEMTREEQDALWDANQAGLWVVDPIDGTTLTAKGMHNALSVLAVSGRGSMYDPSAVFYMDKLVTGPEAADAVDLEAPVAYNLRAVARAKGEKVADLTVVLLDRPRHEGLVQDIRKAGARIKFIADGDVAGAIMAAREDTGVDLLLGLGGTPEGVISAAAIKCLGGIIQGRLAPQDEAERQRALDAGHDLDQILTTDDLVTGDDVFFVATGITDGEILQGVRYRPGAATTQSIVMRSRSGTIRLISAKHSLDKLGVYSAIDFE